MRKGESAAKTESPVEGLGLASAFRNSPNLAISCAHCRQILVGRTVWPASHTLAECRLFQDKDGMVLKLDGRVLLQADCRVLRVLCRVSCASPHAFATVWQVKRISGHLGDIFVAIQATANVNLAVHPERDRVG
jgi:hypothetical protein